MALVFLYGTLLDPALRARRSGSPGTPRRVVPARLPGFRRVCMASGPYPTLRRAPRCHIDGVVAAFPAPALRRLHAYEGPRYTWLVVRVRVARRLLAVGAWVAPAASRRGWAPAGAGCVRAGSA